MTKGNIHQMTIRQRVYSTLIGGLVSESDLFLCIGRTGTLGEIVPVLLPANPLPELPVKVFSYFQLTLQGWERKE